VFKSTDMLITVYGRRLGNRRFSCKI